MSRPALRDSARCTRGDGGGSATREERRPYQREATRVVKKLTVFLLALIARAKPFYSPMRMILR